MLTKAQQKKRSYYEKHREELIAKAKLYAEQNPERVKGYKLKWRFGIGFTEYSQMLKDQQGLCLGCLKPLGDSRATHVDHDHATGQVRGVLCRDCNHCLGQVQDDPCQLDRIADHLERAKLTALTDPRVPDLTRSRKPKPPTHAGTRATAQ